MGGRLAKRPAGRSSAARAAAAALVCVAAACVLSPCVAQQRYRYCVVKDERNRMVTKYCPLLKGDDSRAVCVYGNSRLDCLRIIAKNEADFGVFQAEDLLVARRDKAGDFVITHNIRNFPTEYEYKLVVIVRKSANINTLRDLKYQNLCHPGYGYETDWTDVEGKFFEERVVPQTCDMDLSVNENFIKSSSTFFRAACKAGPWVPDPKLDAALKKKYSNLCSLCDLPKQCSKSDKYWGRTGPLYCLTDGYGDVAWARLDDTNFHFGISPESFPVANHEEYSFLCDDGSHVPLNSSTPCSWLDRPWPAIMTQRNAAVGIQKLIALLKGTDNNWQQALRQLLDAYRLEVVPLSSTKIPEDYLRSVAGFLSANSIIHCERSIKICIYSKMAYAKCIWMSEAAKAFGVKPTIICEIHDNVGKCMEEISTGFMDVVLVESDYLTIAKRKYKLISILHEHINSTSTLYNIGAIVLHSSSIVKLEDLKGKRACFSQYESAGWNTALYTLKHYNLLPSICPYSKAIGNFFPEICFGVSNFSSFNKEHINNICQDSASSSKFIGENGALECLRSGRGDVAFVTYSSIFNGTEIKNWPASRKYKEFALVCPPNNTNECSLSRITPGQIMVHANLSSVKFKEIKTVFEHIGNLFGRYAKQQKSVFQVFGEFDGHRNVLFHDETDRFEDGDFSERKVPKYEDEVLEIDECSNAPVSIIGHHPIVYISIFILLCTL